MAKRERHCFPTGEIAHIWAHQTQDDATNRRNFHVRGRSLISYSTVIGYLLVEKQIALLSRNRYSNTTSGQLRDAQNAVRREGWNVIFTDAMNNKSSWSEVTAKETIKELTDHVKGYLIPSIARKRGSNIIVALNDITTHENWIKLLNPRMKPDFVKPATEAKLLEKATRQQIGIRHGVETREANGVEPFGGRSRRRYGYIPTTPEDKLQEWLDGATGQYNFRWLNMAYMRLRPNDPENTETTMGAVVPTDHIRKIAPLVVDMILKGKTWKTNGHTIHLGNYKLDEITADGAVIAGCHRFKKEEVLRFAKTLGFETDPGVTQTPMLPAQEPIVEAPVTTTTIEPEDPNHPQI